TDAAAKGAPSQGDGKGKVPAKGTSTDDGSAATTAPSAPVDQATTLVVAVVAEVMTPTSASPGVDSNQTAATQTTAAPSAPGAIAAAAASKVAADVAATGSAAAAHTDITVSQGQPTDVKTAVADQAQLAVGAQQATPQTPDPVPTPAASTARLPNDAALIVQAAANAQ